MEVSSPIALIVMIMFRVIVCPELLYRSRFGQPEFGALFLTRLDIQGSGPKT